MAVCGLAALVTVAHVRRSPGLPPWAPLPALLWTAALLGGRVPALLLPAVLVAVVLGAAGRLRDDVRYAVLVGVAASAVVLVVDRDLHGAALAAGLLVAAPPCRCTDVGRT